MARQGRGSDPGPELVSQAQAGVVEARARLIAHYYQPLRAYLRHYTGDPDLADDLTHDVFLYVLTHLDDLADVRRFRPWLFRIARSMATEEGRRRTRRGAVPLDVAATVPVPSPSATDECVRDVLAQLPLALRMVLEAHELSSEPLPALARRLGRSLTAVTKRLTRARRRFAEGYRAVERTEDERP